jgi:hypothetical protein
MGGLRRYLELQAQAKTGLTAGVAVWALVAVVLGTVTFGFVLAAAFIFLAKRYDPLTAALALAGAFLLITLLALFLSLRARRQTIEAARLELVARRQALWLDPKLLGGAMQVGRAVGWRRAAPLLAIGLLAIGIGLPLLRGGKPAADDREAEEAEEELARAA